MAECQPTKRKLEVQDAEGYKVLRRQNATIWKADELTFLEYPEYKAGTKDLSIKKDLSMMEGGNMSPVASSARGSESTSPEGTVQADSPESNSGSIPTEELLLAQILLDFGEEDSQQLFY